MTRYRLRKRTGVILTILLVLLDRFTKYQVEQSLPFHEVVEVFPFLAWYRTYNQGIAFSFLSGMNDVLLIVLTLVILLFVIWLWKNSDRWRWLARLGYALITAGAIGNLFDRVFLGHVVDFILFHIGNWSFAVFNLADVFISVGAAAVILDELLKGTSQKREA
jgi:signal peptidase II